MLKRFLTIPLIVLMWTGCDPKTPNQVDAIFASPVLDSLVLPQTVIDTDTILVGGERLPDDEISITLGASFRLVTSITPISFSARVSGEDGGVIPSASVFRDDGIAPDIAPSDGLYTGVVSFTIVRSLSGTFRLSVVGLGDQELTSNTVSQNFSIVRSNMPPVLSNLIADTLLSLSGGNTTLPIRIDASDPNGPDDVRRVWFDSFRPDGTPSSANPFLMFDDGNTGGISGDLIANDGTYGLTVAFQGAAPGTYRFSFRATDRSRDSSNVIDHFITVVP